MSPSSVQSLHLDQPATGSPLAELLLQPKWQEDVFLVLKGMGLTQRLAADERWV